MRMITSGGTLWQDNRHIIGRPEISTHSAVKSSTQVLAKNWSHLAAQELPSKQRRRLLDFDESDEMILGELELELSRLLIDKLRICNLYLFACRYRKEPALDES